MYVINNTNEIQFKLKNIVLETLELLKKKIHGFSVSIVQTVGINVNSRNYTLDTLEFNDDIIIIITGYHKFKKGIVYSNNYKINNIKNMIIFLCNILKYTSVDIYSGLPEPELLCLKKIPIDLFYPWNITVKKMLKYTNIIESHIMQYNNSIITVDNINISSTINYYSFGNSHGMLGSYETTLHRMSSSIIAQTSNNIMQQDYSYTVARKRSDLYSLMFIAKDSVKKSILRLNAKKINTIHCPIIITANITNEFFSHFISAIDGKNIYKKSTILLNSLNKRIFPKWLDIIENPHIHKGLLSKPFDNEGVQTKYNYIVHNGILCTWLLDNYSAKKLGLSSTGHSGGIHNWFVSNNINVNFNDLLSNMDTGLLVTEFMGQGVNIVNGNYSRGIFGFWIEHGKIQYPVHEVTVSGNLKNMWKNIIDISNDVESRTGVHCGSILLDNMQISGI